MGSILGFTDLDKTNFLHEKYIDFNGFKNNSDLNVIAQTQPKENFKNQKATHTIIGLFLLKKINAKYFLKIIF